MSDMDVVNEIVVFGTIVAIGIFIGIIIGTILENGDTESLGQMVCDERGHGEFVKFEKDEKRIVCEPQEDIEQYDGGFVVVRGKAR